MNDRPSSGRPAQIGRNDLCICGSGKKYKNCCLVNAAAGAARKPSPTSIAEVLPEGALEQALAYHQAGRLAEAEALYEQILRADPNNADALHYSGLAAHQAGRHDEAIARMTRAIEFAPGRAHYHLNLGQVFEAGKEFGRAIDCFRGAVALDPGSESAYCRLAFAQLKSGAFLDAAAGFSHALKIRPGSCEALFGLGNALDKLCRFEEAIVCYRRALALDPAHMAAVNNLGALLYKLGRYDEAIALFRQAILLHPDSPEIFSNLGSSLRMKGEVAEAAECCCKALALRPGFDDAWLNLANACKEMGRLSDAIAAYKEAILLNPAFAVAYVNMADCLADQDRIEEAADSCRRALDLGNYNATAYTNLLFLESSACRISPNEERDLARGWERAVLSESQRAAARVRAPAHSGAFPALPRLGRKLRLGIVSAELGAHAVAVFLQTFLDQLDHGRFHLTLFPTVRRTDARAAHFHQIADSYIPLIGVPDEQAAEMVRAQQIDILIDTTGHTSDSRLAILAHRAAPVQCSYIGYWSTTGLTEMDWYISDNNYSAGCEGQFAEGLWRLPHVAHCYTGDRSLAQSAWQPDPTGRLWLGSYNKYSKIRGESLRLWAKVLTALPEATLVLEDRNGQQEETHARILAQLAEFGVGPERVLFLPPVPGADYARHMALYDRIDIALDTMPFNSGTTAFDALWMGVPLVALEGRRVCSRMASSIVRVLGHPEWVAQDEEEYVRIVAALARDVEGREKLRRTQRARMLASEICDGKGLARALEDAFEVMYDRWLASS